MPYIYHHHHHLSTKIHKSSTDVNTMYFFLFLADDKPLLHEIRNFPTAKGKSTDLCARIVDYSQFSSCVLQDEGSQLKGIEAGHGPKPKNIMNEVFSEWMEGKGKNPVSWRTLISCLEMTGFRELAGELRKEIDGGLSVEDGDGGGGGDSGTFKEEVTTGGGHGVHIRSGSPKEDEEGMDLLILLQWCI